MYINMSQINVMMTQFEATQIFGVFSPVLSTESGFGILSTLRNLSKLFPCCHMRMFMVRPGVSLSHAVIQHSHFVGFPDRTHTKYVQYSTAGEPASEQRVLWLHLARLSRKLLTVHHILLQGESHCEQDHGSGPCLCFFF